MALLQGKLQLQKGLAALRSPASLSNFSEESASFRNHEQQLSTMQRAMSILEILERILSFLPQRSLRYIAPLVCKEWLTLSRPLLFRQFTWWDTPRTTLINLPLSQVAIPKHNARGPGYKNNIIQYWGWTFPKAMYSRTAPSLNRLITVTPELNWLAKEIENCTSLILKLTTKTFYLAATIAATVTPSTNGGSAVFPTQADVVTTTMDALHNKAHSDLIKVIQSLNEQKKLSLLDLHIDMLMDFDGFLKPILENSPSLTSLHLTRATSSILPVGEILERCSHLEELHIECLINPHTPRVAIVLFTGSCINGEFGYTNENTHDNEGVTIAQDQIKVENKCEKKLPKNLRLKRLHLKDVLIREPTLLAIIDAIPTLYELKIQSLDINPFNGSIAHLVSTHVSTPTSFNDISEEAIKIKDWISCNKIEFLQELGRQYPQLTSLHFTRAHHRYSDSQIRSILGSFPKASRWSIAWRDLPDGILRDLNKCVESTKTPHFTDGTSPGHILPSIYSNYLTSLDIVPSTDWTPRWGNALHDFLCSSPHLEHLRAGTIGYYIDNLDINGLLPLSELSTMEDDTDGREDSIPNNASFQHITQQLKGDSEALHSITKSNKVWACRNLKTLHIEFARRSQFDRPNRRQSIVSTSSTFSMTATSTNSSSSSRHYTSKLYTKADAMIDSSPILSRIVFGYVSKACPKLQDLLIRGYKLNMTLQGGFCLLTRLRNLKKVSISQSDCQFSTRDILPWVMKHKRFMTLAQRLQWWAILSGWWKLFHARELRKSSDSMTSSGPTDPVLDISDIHDHERGRNPTNIAGFEKLGQLTDVVDVLREIMSVSAPIPTTGNFFSQEPNLASQGVTLWADHADTVWPNLEFVNIVYGTSQKLRAKGTIVKDLLKRHRPEFRHRVSNTLVPTSKQNFVNVTGQDLVPSHQLLLRAGMIRQSSSGIYSILPYGQRILSKIEGIIDDELEKIGCQKISMPNLLTADKWKTTGRWESTGQETFKLKDRKGSEFLLAPTHEEEVTTLIGNEVQSYRQLPIRVYQIGRKFRDELRARGGLLRGKEFLMKDLYTFDVSKEEALKTYDEVVLAYRRIIKRLGVPFAVAEADTGNIGGTHSHEFHILSKVGEDTLLSCSSCGYTSNEERTIGIIPTDISKAATKFRNTEPVPKWIESLDAIPRSKVRINPKLQFGIMKTSSGDETKPDITTLVAIATTGDRNVNEVKVAKAIGNMEFGDTIEDIKPHLGECKIDKLMLCVDQSLYPGQESPRPKDVHINEVIPEELLSIVKSNDNAKRIEVIYGDYHNCKPGDSCPHCFKSKGTPEPMETTRAIEIGHTFLLGTKYSRPLEAVFSNGEDQESEPIQMGCYGLGITRILASIVEASHDRKGIIWPESVAPFRVVVVTSEDEECIKVAENVYDIVQDALNAKSVVTIDDRVDTTLGFKMKDAELIGYPWMVVIGKGFLRTGNIEIQSRKTGEKWSLEWPKIQPFFQGLGTIN
ncbi:prolyl-tRNA synthetase [Entomortierella beljakovae]|nr:prolyl-tRNA synthetase [Entomortierella beljakovae]